MTKISQYASMITLSPNDLIDVSEWNGVTFDSRSLSYTNLLASLTADLPLTDNSIYDIDGTLTGNRLVLGGGFDLSFANIPLFSIANNLNVGSDTLFVDSGTSRVGIGTPTPTETLEVVGTFGTISTNTVTRKNQLQIIGPDTRNTNLWVSDDNATPKSLSIGVRGTADTLNSGYGNTGDTFIYSDSDSNALNIISQAGGTTDNIRLYAGGDVNTLANSDLHIQGIGATRGYVGINTDAPTEQLELNGQIKITGGAPGTGKVLTSDAVGVGAWAIPAIGPGLPVMDYQTVGISSTVVKNTFNLITVSGLTISLMVADITTQGYSIWVKLGVVGNVTVIDDGGNTIDGAASRILNTQYDTVQFVSDGAGFWWVASTGI
tara:strand:+ start:19042 stop:20172 length:1131 start_codon:yes stop_codon:yes gene_type:complete